MKKSRFELYQSKNKEWHVRFIAANGRVVGNLAEGYKRKAGAMKALGVIFDILMTPKDGIALEDFVEQLKTEGK